MYELPIFPLNTVLFPGMPLRLHIFEERYKQMMQRVMQTNQTFGVSLIKSGSEVLGPLAEPYPTGCTARIIQVEPLEDGRMNLTAVGDERYRIVRVGNPQPYMVAFVQSAPLDSHLSMEVVRGAHVLRARLERYLELLAEHAAITDMSEAGATEGMESEEQDEEAGDLQHDLSQLQLPDDPMMLIYLSAALLQLPAIEKQPLLEADSAALLLQKLQRLFRRELAVLPPLMHITDEDARTAAWAN